MDLEWINDGWIIAATNNKSVGGGIEFSAVPEKPSIIIISIFISIIAVVRIINYQFIR